jgi:type II secretory ATPase GspE/PulE/Tfp pilus assembly ATPase PilB-like protein
MKVAAQALESAQTGDLFTWPMPASFQSMAVSADGSDRDCSVELMKGRVFNAQLLRFAADAETIDVAQRDRGGRHRISIEHVRTIRLTTPVTLVRDAFVMSTTGVHKAHGSDELAFSIRFHDGKTFDGITLGFVKEKGGAFLYLRQDKPLEVIRCFVPAQHLDDGQIGPRVGEASTGKKPDSGWKLAAAVNQQAKVRQEILARLLAERAIVSQEGLKRALLAQEQRPPMKLGEAILEAGLISPAQLQDALSVQALAPGRRLGEIMVDMGMATERLILVALAHTLGIPYVNLREFQIDPAALMTVDSGFANRNQVLPLMLVGESLVVAVENPLAMDFAQRLDFLTHRTIIPVIANPDYLRLRIAKEYADLDSAAMVNAKLAATAGIESARGVTRMNVEHLASELERAAPQLRESAESESDARVSDNALVRMINKIIVDAHAQGASDIHIESNAGKAKSRVRFRKDGELEDYIKLQPAYRNALVSRIKVMAELDISEHRHAQDGKIAFGRFSFLSIELRVAIVPTSDGLEDVVLRILGGVEPLPLTQLGLCERDRTELAQMASHSYGLILVCGPTGSGKTTTLHSLLHTINRPNIKIWTAEDPIEITQEGLRQVQINSRIGWTFAAAMRAFLRADPDVIMVGEMRDAETTKIGIEASLTGHLVFSTLHTNSAAESIIRLLELGMDPFNFADALIGILSQRLARTLCTHCRKPRPATDAEILDLAREYCLESKLDPEAVITQWQATYAVEGQILLHEPTGCEVCSDGYKGRVGVYELLVATPHIKDLIRSRGSAPQVSEAAQLSGMHLRRQDAIDKVLSGVIDLVSARAAST